MKRILIAIVICSLAVSMSPAQVNQPPTPKMTDTELGHYYLNKSKKQKTTGFILMGVGLAAWFGGAAMMVEDDLEGNSIDNGAAVMYLGFGATVASVPLFISAAKNKGRAEILLRYENVPVGFVPQIPRSIPAVGVRVPLSRK
jgi:hypothetical protein